MSALRAVIRVAGLSVVCVSERTSALATHQDQGEGELGERPGPWHVVVPQKALELCRLRPFGWGDRRRAAPKGAITSWLAADPRSMI